MSKEYTLEELAACVGGTLRGGGAELRIRGVADLAEAGPDEAAWLSHERYAKHLAESKAGVILLPQSAAELASPAPVILCGHLDAAIAKLLGSFYEDAAPAPGIHPTALVDPEATIGAEPAIGPYVVIEAGASIGDRCQLHAGVFVGRGATLGDDCTLWPNVVVRDGCHLGSRAVVHSCAVIGADGLGFYFAEGRHNKIPHAGGVIIGDDVEIGACSCVDRAKFGNTMIGDGTKIDNLVQVAHNVRIGQHCVFAAQCAFAGSVRIGHYCISGGRTAVVDHVRIGDGVRIAGGGTVVTKDLPPGSGVSGFPAQDHRREMREQAGLRKLPDLLERIRQLEARVKELEAAADH
jgi:UDP-3-O-[3-hydroxymyristoyl] glucosamine N-acyltransferase